MRSAPVDVTVDRHTFIGGSEAHELMNEKQYGRGCARALAYRKTRIEPDFTEAKPDPILLNRGHLLEPLVAQMYRAETGRHLLRSGKLRRHPKIAGCGVHLDRMVVAGAGGVSETGDAEIKTHKEGPYLNILRNGLPPGHNLQAQWAMFVTGHSWCAFIILGLGVEAGLALKHFDITRDQELMGIFEEAATKFWELVARGELPPQLPDPEDQRCRICPWRLKCRGEAIDPDELASIMAEQAGKKTLVRIQNEELEQAIADRELILSEMKALSSDNEEDPGALQLVSARIKELLNETEGALVGPYKVYQYPSMFSGVDVKQLKADAPEIYKKYYITKRPTGGRWLRVYGPRSSE